MLLPYVYPPIIDVYSGVAGNVSALMLSPKSEAMIVRNHFLLTYYESLKAPGFNWLYYDDSFKEERSIREELETGGLCEKIIGYLDAKYYVQIFLDHFYLPCSSKYGKWHFVHDNATIFGYDLEKRVFYVGDNFVVGKFTIETVDFNSLEKARTGLSAAPAQIFRINDDWGEISAETIYLTLRGYYESKCCFEESMINPVNISLDGGKKVIFGMDFYDFLRDQIEDCNDKTYDVRTFHILYNHMKLYEDVIKLLEDFGTSVDVERLRAEANGLVEDALLLRNKYIKFNITKKNKEKLTDLLDSLREREKNILENILDIS